MQVYKQRLARTEDQVRQVESDIDTHRNALSTVSQIWEQVIILLMDFNGLV
jgi:hypothetical protein